MKKMQRILLTVLLAIAVLATAAQAATIYEKDGFKYQVKGDWQIQLRQDPGVGQELDVEYDDLEIKNSITYKISDALTAFGQVDFGFKNAANKGQDADLEEAYVGLDFGIVSAMIGKTDSAADEFGVEQSYEIIVAEDVFDEVGSLSGDDLIKVKAEFGDAITVVLAHELSADSENSGNEEFTDLFVGAEFAGFELGAAYQQYEDDVLAPTSDATIYGISVAYDAKVVKVGVDYSKSNDDLNAANEMSVINAAVSGKVSKMTKIAAGYVTQDFDSSTIDDVNGWYANVTHKLNKKVSVFAEIEDDDKTDSDTGYMLGMRLKF